jgi:hypothetical protein
MTRAEGEWIDETGLVLCKDSRSKLFSAEILRGCPLGLNSQEKNVCPCRRRVKVELRDGNVRLLTCQFPYTWRGDLIRFPIAFAQLLKRRFKAR